MMYAFKFVNLSMIKCTINHKPIGYILSIFHFIRRGCLGAARGGGGGGGSTVSKDVNSEFIHDDR